MRTLTPIDHQPGYYRDTTTGRVIGIHDFHPFEISERVEGIEWQWFREEPCEPLDDFIFQGWRFTVAEPPNPRELQQLVSLRIGVETVAFAVLGSIVSLPLRTQRVVLNERFPELGYFVPKATFVGVYLHERPVEGAGLRVHIYGLRRPAVVY